MVPVRRRLFVLAAAAIAPLATIAGFGLLALVAQQREQAARAGIELTRALATAVAAELGRSVSVLEVMATAPTLDAGELAGFQDRAMRAVATQPYWKAIVLVDGSGRPIVDTRVPAALELPALGRAGIEQVRRSMAPAVGSLDEYRDPATGVTALAFSVAVPVLREGRVRSVLVALVTPDAIVDILKRQRVPNDWVISIFDAEGRRVARTRLHPETLGRPARRASWR